MWLLIGTVDKHFLAEDRNINYTRWRLETCEEAQGRKTTSKGIVFISEMEKFMGYISENPSEASKICFTMFSSAFKTPQMQVCDKT